MGKGGNNKFCLHNSPNTNGKYLAEFSLEYKLVCGCPRGVMVKAMDCRIVVSEFGLQSRYYVHFLTNTLEKAMNPIILPAVG